MTTPTWYDLLDVEPTAGTDEIRAAWRGAIADLDPTERRFATLNEAASVLLDSARRSAYDAQLPEPAVVEAPELEPAVVEPAVVEPAVVEPAGVSTGSTTDGVSTGSTSEGVSTGSTSEGVSTGSTSEGVSTGSTSVRAPYVVPGWVLATVGVVAVAAVALAAILGSRPVPDPIVQDSAQVTSGSKVTDIEQPAIAAVAAAKAAVVPVLSYDYRHLDADQKAAGDVMTDSYRTAYDKLFDKLKASAVSTQTAITTKVVGSAIVRAGGDRVQVLLFVDRPTTNKANTTPISYQDQVTLTMQRVGDRWLVDGMNTDQIPQ